MGFFQKYKQIAAVIVVLFAFIPSKAQFIPPANWTVTFENKPMEVGEEVYLIFSTKIPEGYHIYSNDFSENCPPKKAQFTFETSKSFVIIGEPIPEGAHHYIDDVFHCEVSDFEEKAVLKQKIRVLDKHVEIKGFLEYQMCSESACVDHEFPFELEAHLTKKPENVSTEQKPLKETQETDKPKKLAEKEEPEETSNPVKPIKTESSQKDQEFITKIQAYKQSENDTLPCQKWTPIFSSDAKNASKSWFLFFLLSFAAGLVALLTPCVFPMIPMTVSFFIKDNQSRSKGIRNGIIFGISILTIYGLIGAFVSITKNVDFAHWLSTHWIPNILFFIIFWIFAASFFGAFEITLPSRLVNKIDKQADRGGLLGVFFMAFTIVLVSFSCTGPIVSSVLVESVQGGSRLKPFIAMLAFSLAFALPFSLFAIFPKWLNNVPKSGGWLNSVKVVLGFVELALGLKFLSVADQTYHWHLLDRHVYLALWISIFGLMGFYLLGRLKFAHDADLPFLKVPRLLFAMLTFSFVIYLIPGMWGAPLKALAGYLPPISSSEFDIRNIVREEMGNEKMLCETPKYKDQGLHIPHELPGYFDWEQGLLCAKKLKKPVFIDFTGHGCVNCRKLEDKVWSNPRAKRLLKENFVILSLYTDDKEIMLPPNEQFTAKFDGREVQNLGKKNTYIQFCFFGSNQQPQYAILDDQANLLMPTVSYDDVNETKKFIDYLKQGLASFENSKKR